jgi:hypothetical protein
MVHLWYGMTGNISGKYFLGVLVNIPKCPWKPVPPQSFEASYAPVRRGIRPAYLVILVYTDTKSKRYH